MAAASDRGSAEPPGRLRIEAGPLAQQRAQVQRMPAGVLVQPPDHLRRPAAPARARPPATRPRPGPARRAGSAAGSPRSTASAGPSRPAGRRAPVGHHGHHRVHRQPPQHERQRLDRLAVGPLQVIDQDRHRRRGLLLAHHLQQPRAHRERRDGRAGPGRWLTRREAAPAARSSWSTSPKSRSASAWLGPGRQHPQARRPRPGTAAPGPSSRPRDRPRWPPATAVPSPPAAMTSATRASSAARPTKTSSGGCRSCTRPPTPSLATATPDT